MLTTLIPTQTRQQLVHKAKLLGIGWSVLASTAATVGGIIGWVEIQRSDKR